jgi:hypothetical protein
MLREHTGRLWTVSGFKTGYLCSFLDIVGCCWTSGWWAHEDSNLEPKDYESSALTIEL